MNEIARIDDAPLPERYERAKAALADCDNLDECLQWVDKHVALASYAKQARDERLLAYAERIRLRVERRAGELLLQLDKRKPGPKSELNAAEGIKLSRDTLAKNAGLSRKQAITAMRVANVSPERFDELVEQPKRPATLTKIAEEGTRKRLDPESWLRGRTPKQFEKVMAFTSALSSAHRALVESGRFDAARDFIDAEDLKSFIPKAKEILKAIKLIELELRNAER
jgi:hypothetical protein